MTTALSKPRDADVYDRGIPDDRTIYLSYVHHGANHGAPARAHRALLSQGYVFSDQHMRQAIKRYERAHPVLDEPRPFDLKKYQNYQIKYDGNWCYFPPKYVHLDITERYGGLTRDHLHRDEQLSDYLMIGMAALAVITTAPLWRVHTVFAVVMTTMWLIGLAGFVWMRWHYEWRHARL